jgi:GTP-binding protein Era
VLVVGTQADRGPPRADEPAPDLAVSARTGEGIDALLEAVIAQLPVAPRYYDDPDHITDRPLRWLAAEAVREAVFEELEQELPYATAVEIESFDESREDCVLIRAQLLVERPSQKGIVIGAGGEQVKRIGIRARQALEALLENRVHLELWVKVEANWTKKRRRLESLGYR